MAKIKRGAFFAFEGGEGTGKSTQTRRLAGWLQERGFKVLLTREPGGTDFGKQLRDLLLHKDLPHLSMRAELLLYLADRAQHVDQAIRPALERGEIVVSDRFSDSSVVYQGMSRGLGVPAVKSLNRFATGGLSPDLVFLLDLSESLGRERALKRTQDLRGQKGLSRGLDRMEREPDGFHQEVRKGFLKIAKQNASRFRVLDAQKEESAIAARIQKEVETKLRRMRLWRDK